MSKYLPVNRALLLLVIMVALSQVGCSVLAMFMDGGASLTELQSKYWTVVSTNSGDYCAPDGTNEKYHTEPYDCFGKSGQCPLYEEAINGQMPQDATEMFLDATKLRGDDSGWVGDTFAMSCKYSTETGAELFASAFRGLGYAGHQEGGKRMAKVVKEGENLTKDQYTDLTLATFHSGNHSAFAEVFQHLTERDDDEVGDAQGAAVDLMRSLDLENAKSYCENQLGEQADQTLRNKCIRYLASIEATDSADAIYRHLQETPDTVVRALGQLEYEPAKDRIIARADEGNLAALVAAINLGESSYWETLKMRIHGYKDEGARERVEERGKRFLDRKGAKEAILESVLIKDEEISEELMTELGSITDKSEAEDELVWAHAQVAIAQRGGPIDGVVTALESPNADVREFTVLATAIANPAQSNLNAGINDYGTQVVTNTELEPELLDFYDKESDPKLRYGALFAAASIRSLNQ